MSKHPCEEETSVEEAAHLVRRYLNGRTRSHQLAHLEFVLSLDPKALGHLFDDEVITPEEREALLRRTTDLIIDGVDFRDMPLEVFEGFFDSMPNLEKVTIYGATRDHALRYFGGQLRPCNCHVGGKHVYWRAIDYLTLTFDETSDGDTDRHQGSIFESGPRTQHLDVTFKEWGPATATDLDNWLVQQPLKSLCMRFLKLTDISMYPFNWGKFGDHIFRAENSDRCPQTAEMTRIVLDHVDFSNDFGRFLDFMRQVSQVPKLGRLELQDCRVPPEWWWRVIDNLACMRVEVLVLNLAMGSQGAAALRYALKSMRGLKYLDVSLAMGENDEEDLFEYIQLKKLDIKLEGTNAIYVQN